MGHRAGVHAVFQEVPRAQPVQTQEGMGSLGMENEEAAGRDSDTGLIGQELQSEGLRVDQAGRPSLGQQAEQQGSHKAGGLQESPRGP